MRRFLYFFPRLPGVNERMLSDRGALDRFTSRAGGGELLEHVIMGTDRGPDGGAGCFVACGSRVPSFEPGRMPWIQGEKFWVGIEDSPPRPDDLVRTICISGYEAVLLDGATWNIPLLHRWDESIAGHVPNLPRAMAPVLRNGVQGVELKVRAEFAAVDAIATKIFAAFITEKTLPLDVVLSDAVSILNVNYRIGVEEAGLLGLLDVQSALQVISMSIDLPAMRSQAEQLAATGLAYVEPQIRDE